MSKFAKLIRNPRQFLLDSKVWRRALLAPRHVSFFAARSAGFPPTQVSHEWERSLIERIAALVPVLLVPDDSEAGGDWIAVRRMDQQRLTQAIAALADPTWQVQLYGARNANFAVTPHRLFALDDFLTKQKHVTAAFEQTLDGRPQQVQLRFEFWEDNGQHLTSPRRNPIARRLSKHVVDDLGLFKPGRPRHVQELIRHPLPTTCQFDIDVVYTWVNHRDPEWRRMYARAVGDLSIASSQDDGRSLDRFLSRDELKYSLRSVAAFAPWVRRIHIVSNCAPPPWLKMDHPKIRWVDHADILPAAVLPTFSSHAIEARLHHVPGLSDHFLYFNDDFFLGRPTTPEDFFFSNGIAKSFTEEYGAVNGVVNANDPDYLNAARNGQRLLEQRFQRTATALHKHTPYALNRVVLREMEEAFPEAYHRTIHSAFRSLDDISTVSFMYHHYAYLTGRAQYCTRNAVLLKQASTNYLTRMLELVDGSRVALSICVNDGQGSADDSHWNRHVKGFLDAMYGEPCEFEQTANAEAERSLAHDPIHA